MSCPFRALGLTPSATPGEVKVRWHELAIQHHPDHGGAVEEFTTLRAAYQAAYAAALETPCVQCCGSGTRLVPGGFRNLELPCDVCGGSGRRY